MEQLTTESTKRKCYKVSSWVKLQRIEGKIIVIVVTRIKVTRNTRSRIKKMTNACLRKVVKAHLGSKFISLEMRVRIPCYKCELSVDDEILTFKIKDKIYVDTETFVEDYNGVIPDKITVGEGYGVLSIGEPQISEIDLFATLFNHFELSRSNLVNSWANKTPNLSSGSYNNCAVNTLSEELCLITPIEVNSDSIIHNKPSDTLVILTNSQNLDLDKKITDQHEIMLGIDSNTMWIEQDDDNNIVTYEKDLDLTFI